ncbi:MAG: hypothetical protein JSR89_05065 [Proteobacteria bacterium]|nr:hypothetical protein [Pseudomonadota bacterium]
MKLWKDRDLDFDGMLFAVFMLFEAEPAISDMLSSEPDHIGTTNAGEITTTNFHCTDENIPPAVSDLAL